MRRLPVPLLSRATVYSACVSGVADAGLLAKFAAAAVAVDEAAELYTARAITNDLHLFPAAAWGNGHQIVLQNLTKQEFVGLYEGQMSNSKGRGRGYYDAIKVTELGICPLCGFGHVSTLDHFAPKARYPIFSVLPINLIPACSDCNRGKGSAVLEADKALPHPYFEDPRVDTDIWLKCDVIQSHPVTVSYRVEVPMLWDAGISSRIRNHFSDHNLATRFSVQAASHLSTIKGFLASLTPEELKWHMDRKVASFPRPNQWESALYAGLHRSPWFMAEGYRG